MHQGECETCTETMAYVGSRWKFIVYFFCGGGAPTPLNSSRSRVLTLVALLLEKIASESMLGLWSYVQSNTANT